MTRPRLFLQTLVILTLSIITFCLILISVSKLIDIDDRFRLLSPYLFWSLLPAVAFTVIFWVSLAIAWIVGQMKNWLADYPFL